MPDRPPFVIPDRTPFVIPDLIGHLNPLHLQRFPVISTEAEKSLY